MLGFLSFPCICNMLTSLLMKNTTFCDVTPCSLVEMYQRFGETYCVHLQLRRVNNTEKWIQREEERTWSLKMQAVGFFETWCRLHDVTFQKTIFFIVTAMRTSKSSVFIFTPFCTSGTYRRSYHQMWPHCGWLLGGNQFNVTLLLGT